MTKQGSSKKKTKRNSRRKASKYPALDRNKNLPSRRDYIDMDYIDGVFNENGECTIRPLLDHEKEFLNQFIEETVVTNFVPNDEYRRLQKQRKAIIEDATVQSLKEQLNATKEAENNKTNRKRIRDLYDIIRLTKKQNEETYEDDLIEINSKMKELREDLLLYPDVRDHKQFYDENNKRNSCIHNKKKTERRLDSLDLKVHEQYLGESLYNYSGESYLIDCIERSRWEAETERLASQDKPKKTLKHRK